MLSLKEKIQNRINELAIKHSDKREAIYQLNWVIELIEEMVA